MTKKHSTKRALIASILLLCLCFTSLVGTTFAWFTDSASSADNVIQTGKLDVQLLMHNGTEYVDISHSEKPIFGEGGLIAEWEDVDLLWEPGKTQIVYLGVKNDGNLKLKYNVLVDVEDHGLVGALDYAIIDGATKDDAAAFNITSWADIVAIDGVQVGLIEAGRTVAAENGMIEAQDYDYFALAVHMKEEAGNEYQDKNVVIDITIIATQATGEFDSIGDDYDAEAPLDSLKGMMVKVGDHYFPDIPSALAIVEDGGTIELVESLNTTNTPLTETVVIDKEVTLIPNGMYFVSSAPATFTVVEGGKLTVDEGSFTIKNTATNGACVLVDGGEFVMAGGSFDGHTAVRTTEGKSSTVTLAAGWSNRVTVGFDSKGNDTINVTGGSLYSSKESIKTTAGTHVNINVTGGLLSSRTDQYSAAVNLQSTATINMTGGKIENTYSSGYNGSPAIEANVAPTTINLSGTAALSSNGTCVMLGSHMSPPAVLPERFVLNVSGNATINATSVMGFGIRYAQDACDVTIGGNAKVNATYQAIQFNTNSYVYTNSTLTIKENATITSTAGRIGGGYGVAAYGDVTITGGTVYGSTIGVANYGGNLVIDNSVSGSAIKISGGTSLDAGPGANLTIKGTPEIVGYTYPEFVGNESDLSAALAAGGNAYLTGDLSVNNQVEVNGGKLNGNGATVTVDRNASTTYNKDDCAISTTGGTVSNITVIGNPNNTRAIGSGSTGDTVLTSNLTVEGVTVNKVMYALNGTGATGNETVSASNSTLYGWISFSNIKQLTLKNCTLGMGDSYDGYMVVYGNTKFDSCNFEGVFDLGARLGDDGEVCGKGSTITFSNCYYDGEKVTAENFVDLFFYGPGDERDFGNLMRAYTIKVDGKTVDNSAYV